MKKAASRRRGTVLVAPDKFKGSLTAIEAAQAIAAGLRSTWPDCDIDLCPIADGGDGSVDAAVAAGFTRIELDATGPTGRPVHTSYAESDAVALVELAAVSGLSRLEDGPAPMTSSTYGLGEAVRHAARRGARTVILALGGSASTDGGAGMLVALGAQVRDQDGLQLQGRGCDLAAAASLDLASLDPAIAGVRFVLASDVTNPLLGPSGAAAVYAPQKGAAPDEVALLEVGLARWRKVMNRATGRDMSDVAGAGAAGGTGFAALAALQAQPGSGADLMFDLVDIRTRLAGAALVVTGEGSFDGQTLAGKGPGELVRISNEIGVPAAVIAGRIMLSDEQRRTTAAGWYRALADYEPDLHRSIDNAADLLQRAGAELSTVVRQADAAQRTPAGSRDRQSCAALADGLAPRRT